MDKAFLLSCKLISRDEVVNMAKKHPMFPVITALDSAIWAGANLDNFGYTNYALEGGKEAVIFNGTNSLTLADLFPHDRHYGINYISTFKLPQNFCAFLAENFGSFENALASVDNLDGAFGCPTRIEKVCDKDGKFMWYTLQISQVRAPSNKASVEEHNTYHQKSHYATGNHFLGAMEKRGCKVKYASLQEISFNDKYYVCSPAMAGKTKGRDLMDKDHNRLLCVKSVKFRILNFDKDARTLSLTLDSANNGGVPYKFDATGMTQGKTHHKEAQPLRDYVEQAVPQTIFRSFLPPEKTRERTPDFCPFYPEV